MTARGICCVLEAVPVSTGALLHQQPREANPLPLGTSLEQELVCGAGGDGVLLTKVL